MVVDVRFFVGCMFIKICCFLACTLLEGMVIL